MTEGASSISLDPGLTLEIGAHTYIHDRRIRNPSGASTNISIGGFCSIATDLTIIGYDHYHEWVTTYPFLDYQTRPAWPGTKGIPYPQDPRFGSNKSRGEIAIGNDVWICYNVKLFKGVTIGDGAVIGACSLVNKSVEPYTIVAGTPARLIRKRFSDKEIVFLLQIKWWSWPDEMINRYMPYLCSSKLGELENLLSTDPEYLQIKAKARAEECLALADAAYALNDLDGACAALKEGLSHTPDAVPLLVCFGNIRFQLGAFAEARDSFKQASEIRPNNADILVRLAAAASRCGDTDLLEPTLKRALDLDPENSDLLRLSINRNLEQSLFADGARQCCALIRSNPNDLLLLLQLGKCLREINDIVSARWCYQQALKVDPACQLARETLQRLNGHHRTPPVRPQLEFRQVAVSN